MWDASDGGVVYERDKLYEEVWSEPVTAVAKRYGVSDVAIHKTCKRLAIPVPPRGYWARLRAGKPVERQPLPETDGPTEARGVSRKRESEPVGCSGEARVKLPFLSEQERAKVLEVCEGIRPKDRLVKPHALIVQDREARAERKRREREDRRDLSTHVPNTYPYQTRRPLAGFLDIRVPDDHMGRAYRLLDALFSAIEEFGGSVRAGETTTVVVMGEPAKIRLASKDDLFTLVIGEHDAPRKNWRDTQRRQLETELGSFLLGLYEVARVSRTQREERAREEERRRVEAERRQARAKAQQEEMARYTALENAALDWHRARILEGYVAEMEKAASAETDQEKQAELLEQAAWAKAKIAWLDPLVAAKDPVLGVRRHDRPEGEKAVLEVFNPYELFRRW
jgi:hypothetical protein